MPLTSENLKGIWAGLPVPWNKRDEIDEDALRENVRRICRAGVHGVYTHGTTGEFYAQTAEEWKQVVTATVEECRNFRIPVQAGCTALCTAEAIRKARFAQEAGADGVQIAFPFWLPLTDGQAVRFLGDVSDAAHGMPLILYNTERAKKLLTTELLVRLRDAGVPLIGVKNVRRTEEITGFLEVDPGLKVFVGEPHLASYWQWGARGSYSSFVYACPRFILRYYTLCEQGGEEASAIGRTLQRFIFEYVVPRLKRGMYDTAFDRTFATMTGFLTGSLLNSRLPYDAATEADVEECRQWFARNLPAFLTEI